MAIIPGISIGQIRWLVKFTELGVLNVARDGTTTWTGPWPNAPSPSPRIVALLESSGFLDARGVEYRLSEKGRKAADAFYGSGGNGIALTSTHVKWALMLRERGPLVKRDGKIGWEDKAQRRAYLDHPRPSTLEKLVADGVVKQEGDRYCLSPDWLKRIEGVDLKLSEDQDLFLMAPWLMKFRDRGDLTITQQEILPPRFRGASSKVIPAKRIWPGQKVTTDAPGVGALALMMKRGWVIEKSERVYTITPEGIEAVNAL